MSVAAQKRKRLIVSAVAAVVAVGAVALVLTQSGGLKPASPPIATPGVVTGTGTTKLVVAAADISQGSPILPGLVTVADVPQVAVPPDGTAYSDPKQVTSQYAAVKIPRGTILQSTFLISQPSSDARRTDPPLDIKPGDVAMSIPFDEAKGAGGYVHPSDHLDILVIDSSGNVHYGLQDVLVLKVGGFSQQSASGAAASTTPATLIVVELPREKAAVLAYLINLNGGQQVLRYVLRPAANYNAGKLPNSDPITPGNLVQYLDS